MKPSAGKPATPLAPNAQDGEPVIIVLERDIESLNTNALWVARIIGFQVSANVMILSQSGETRLFPDQQSQRPSRASGLYRWMRLINSLGVAVVVREVFVAVLVSAAVFFRGRSGMRAFVEKGVLRGVKIGDAVYDHFIKRKLRFQKPHLHPIGLMRSVLAALFTIHRFKRILGSGNVKGLCLTTRATLSGRVTARCAVVAGIPVYEIGGSGPLFRVYRALPSLSEAFYFMNSEDVHQPAADSNWVQVVDTYLSRRTSASRSSGDALMRGARDVEGAFREKKIMSAHAFSHHFIPADHQTKPVVVIFGHCFSDAPHNAGDLLFLDFYEALIRTLEFARLNGAVNWFVKPHPSRASYGEQGIVEEQIRKLKSPSVFLWPEEVSTKSALDWAAGVVTVNGTIGLEAACYGKPALLGGASAYGHLGFSKNPKTLEDYEKEISNAHRWKPLTSSQRDSAKKTLYGYHNLGASSLPSGEEEIDIEDKVQSVLDGRRDKVWLS